MGDLFSDKMIKPMLIGADSDPFDSPDYIYELKLDGERCIAYLDPNSGTELRNKRNIKMLPKVPELGVIHENICRRCILDGELTVIKDGRPDFYEIQRRSLMSNTVKIGIAAKMYPATFTAFDILYLDSEPTVQLPLMERKGLLESAIKTENSSFAFSRYIEEKGIAFYELAAKKELEGIVAKRRDSKYYFDKRTKDWIKIKYLQDDDYVVCGYIHKANNMSSIVLGQYLNGVLIYKGHVTLGVSGTAFKEILKMTRQNNPPFPVPAGNDDAVWIAPHLVCTVEYMMKTAKGGMRQAVFKGLRYDKLPAECISHPQPK